MALSNLFERGRDFGWTIIDMFNDPNARSKTTKFISLLIAIVIVILLILALWWNQTPDEFDPIDNAKEMAAVRQQQIVTGYASTATP